MADVNLINLPEKTTPAETDIVIIEDAVATKRMTWSNLVKPIKDMIGNLASLTTTHKTSVVGAINEVDNTVAAHEAEYATKGKAGHIKLPEDWKTITFLNGWVGSYTPRYSKDEFGIVHCSGTITGGANASGTSIFEFPPGYRPLDRIYPVSRGYKPTTQLFIPLLVLPTGVVSIASSEAPVEIHFNFSFRSDL